MVNGGRDVLLGLALSKCLELSKVLSTLKGASTLQSA